MYRVYPQMATSIGKNVNEISSYWCVLRRECSRMIHNLHVITSNNHSSNPQQPIHSLRLAPVSHKLPGRLVEHHWVRQIFHRRI